MFYQCERTRIQRGIEGARRMRMAGAYIAGEEYRLAQIRTYVDCDEYIENLIQAYEMNEITSWELPEQPEVLTDEQGERCRLAARTIRNAARRRCNMDYVEYRIIRYAADGR